MLKLANRPVALGLISLAAVPTLSACASPSRWTLSIDKVGPTYVPAIQVNGTPQRLVALTIQGSPAQIAPLIERTKADGWKARLLGEDTIQIDPVGHSMDEVAALNIRVENGEFGDNLKFNVIMRPDGKAKG